MWLPGFDLQAGRGEAAVDQVAPVLDLLQVWSYASNESASQPDFYEFILVSPPAWARHLALVNIARPA